MTDHEKLMSALPSVEQISRVIDPSAWRFYDANDCKRPTMTKAALIKAMFIDALAKAEQLERGKP